MIKMRYYTHIAGSLIFALAIAVLFSIEVSSVYLFLASVAAPFLDILDSFLGTHERKTHNIFILFGSLAVAMLHFQIGMAIFAAVFSHIFLDLLNVHGCPLLYPIKEIKFVGLREKHRVRTGTKQEKALFLFFAVIFVTVMLGNYQVFAMIDSQTEYVATSNDVISNNSTNVTGNMKTNNNINIQADQIDGEKNITIKSSANQTNIIIKDI